MRSVAARTTTLVALLLAATGGGRLRADEDAAVREARALYDEGAEAARVLDPGKGAPPPAATFYLELDPGLHVFTLTRRGFGDAVVRQHFAPGSRTELRLEVERLPATLHVQASEPGAVVSVDEVDVG